MSDSNFDFDLDAAAGDDVLTRDWPAEHPSKYEPPTGDGNLGAKVSRVARGS